MVSHTNSNQFLTILLKVNKFPRFGNWNEKQNLVQIHKYKRQLSDPHRNIHKDLTERKTTFVPNNRLCSSWKKWRTFHVSKQRTIHIMWRHTLERMQTSDCAWLREMESPMTAQALFRIKLRNLFGSNWGKSHSLGAHLQYRKSLSGLPFFKQFWWDSMRSQLSLL